MAYKTSPYFYRTVLALGYSTLMTASTVAATAQPRALTQNPSIHNPSVNRGSARLVRIAGSNEKRTLNLPLGCSYTFPTFSFVGIAGLSNVAGGENSGVVAGVSNEACEGDTGILSGEGNIVGGAGGTYYSVIVGGSGNALNVAPYSFIGGGGANLIAGPQTGTYEVFNDGIVAGETNSISGGDSIIGAGQSNVITGSLQLYERTGQDSSIAAGSQNAISSQYASIGAGRLNSVSGESSSIDSGVGNSVSAMYSQIGGGWQNTVSGEYAGIGSGYGNIVTGLVASIGGGYENTASGRNSTVPGGAYNVASGVGSLAAGYKANALNQGAFVWSDDVAGSATLASTASNQFVARASGGFYLYSSPTLTTGVQLAPGSGSWSTLSDRAVKTDIRSVDDQRILARIASMPVSEWSYRAQGTSVRHLGPMAQDFRSAFGLGEDDRHISNVDEEGVALAAIKALQAENAAKDRQIANMRSTDEAKFAALERRLAALEARH